MNFERIASIAARECVRQQVGLGELADLLRAYQTAKTAARRFTLITEGVLLDLAKAIEPLNGGRYRVTPVTFSDCGDSCHSSQVPSKIRQLLAQQPCRQLFGVDLHSDFVPDVDYWVKEFLWIHPFTDGNGRTAWILRTWLLDHWSFPDSLPDYFGSKTLVGG
jgi:Fic/DOC family